MNSDMINFLIGYFIAINIVGTVLIWIKVRIESVKIGDKLMNTILTIISSIGGFIGVLVGAEMMDYQQDNKWFRRRIKIIVFIEACILIYYIYSKIN